MYVKKILIFACTSVLVLLSGCNSKVVSDINETASSEVAIEKYGDSLKKDDIKNVSLNSADITENISSNDSIAEDITSVSSEAEELRTDPPDIYVPDTVYNESVSVIPDNISQNTLTENTDTGSAADTENSDTEKPANSQPDVPDTSADSVTVSKTYIEKKYGSYDAYLQAIVDGINKLRAEYGNAPLVRNSYADEIAYKVNCEQTGENTGHWTASQRPALAGLNRGLESIGLAENSFRSNYADADYVAYTLTLEHTKGIVLYPDEYYIGISVLPSEFYRGYIVITINTFTEKNLNN